MAQATVRFHRLAAVEYKSALAWYRIRSQKAAGEFRDELSRVMQRLRTVPDHGTVSRDCFQWRIPMDSPGRFPYVLYFKVVSPGVITIYAFAHARRRLGYWLRRR
jgi:hypothetical protein